MKRKFIVVVPCTVVDRYLIVAESPEDAIRKMAGSMDEITERNPDGDYQMLADDDFMPHRTTFDYEPDTQWDKAFIVDEVK